MTSSIFVLLLMLAPIQLETGRFSIVQNGQRIGTEEFSITAKGTGYLVEGRTQLAGDPTILSSRMELDAMLNPIAYEYRQGPATLSLKIAQPLSEVTSSNGGAESSTGFRFAPGSFIVDNNLFHHYLLLLYRVGNKGATLPIFVPQDMRQGSATIVSKGNLKYELQMGDIRLQATTDANGRLLKLEVPDANVVIER
jgi:hypothetical protein